MTGPFPIVLVKPAPDKLLAPATVQDGPLQPETCCMQSFVIFLVVTVSQIQSDIPNPHVKDLSIPISHHATMQIKWFLNYNIELLEERMGPKMQLLYKTSNTSTWRSSLPLSSSRNQRHAQRSIKLFSMFCFFWLFGEMRND